MEGFGTIHHVVPQGIRRLPIVLDDRDRIAYLRRLAAVTRERDWLVYAGSLLDTHDHRLVQTPNADLGAGMRRILGGHARWLNVRHQTDGSVFTPRFWSRRIGSDEQFRSTFLYIVLNPVAAGLCEHPLEWRWGTYRATVELPAAELGPGEQRLLACFGNTPKEAQAQLVSIVDDAVVRLQRKRAASARDLWDIAASASPDFSLH
jgi:putative transposase